MLSYNGCCKSIHILILLFVSTIVLAGEPVPLLKLNEEAIVFDGQVTERIWEGIAPLALTTQYPVYKADPINNTEMRMAYDNEYLYVSSKNFVQSPAHITSNSKKRDALAITDWFGLVIDSYNDKQNGLGFFTTPAGLRMDAAVLNDASSRDPINISWNNFWDVKVSQDEKGWYAEMRIPWTSLQFQPKDGTVVMGITMWRYSAKNNEIVITPDISPDYGEWGAWRPSLAKEYVFEGITPKKPFYVTPYALGGFSKSQVLNDAGTNYDATNKIVREIGLDLKYGISNNWTLDFSLNTDFAQVEADNQQVNLTRFNLFFPEKRLFFQERSGIFEFSFPRGNKLFYSRNIGIDEDGKAIPIIGGARVTGRSGKWDVGFLNMQTANTDDFRGENFTVARVLKQVINSNSNAGFIFTNRMDFNGEHNTAFGFDTSIRLFGQVFLTARTAQTIDNDSEHSLIDFDTQKSFMSLVKRSQKGFVFAGSLTRVGKDYNPEVGFERRTDYFRHGDRLQYLWYPKGDHFLFRHGPQASGQFFWDNSTKDLITMNYGFGYAFEFRNSSSFEFSYRPNIDVLTDPFELSDDVTIPTGRYTFKNWRIEATTNMTVPLFAAFEFNKGGFYDGERTSITVSPTFQASSSLELSGSYEYNHIDFEQRNETFKVHLASLNALVMFDTKLSISSLLQYNSLDKNFLGNIRFRYNPKEGVDLYIVYNDLLNTDRFRMENLEIPRSSERTILVKYSYTFRL